MINAAVMVIQPPPGVPPGDGPFSMLNACAVVNDGRAEIDHGRAGGRLERATTQHDADMTPAREGDPHLRLAALLRRTADLARRAEPWHTTARVRLAGGRERVTDITQRGPEPAGFLAAAERMERHAAEQAAITADIRAAAARLAAAPSADAALERLRATIARADEAAGPPMEKPMPTKQKCKPVPATQAGSLSDRVVMIPTTTPTAPAESGATGGGSAPATPFGGVAISGSGPTVGADRSPVVPLTMAEQGFTRTLAEIRVLVKAHDSEATEDAVRRLASLTDIQGRGLTALVDYIAGPDAVPAGSGGLDLVAAALAQLREAAAVVKRRQDEGLLPALLRHVAALDLAVSEERARADKAEAVATAANREALDLRNALFRIRAATDGLDGPAFDPRRVADRALEVAEERWALQQQVEEAKAQAERLAALWASERRRADGLERVAEHARTHRAPRPVGPTIISPALAAAARDIACNACSQAVDAIADAMGLEETDPRAIARAVSAFVDDVDGLATTIGGGADPTKAIDEIEAHLRLVPELREDLAAERRAVATYEAHLRTIGGELAALRAQIDAGTARALCHAQEATR